MNAIYTAIAGEYDNLQPRPLVRGCWFIAFMEDLKKHQNEKWRMRQLLPCHSDPVRNSKRYKVLSHLVLPDIKYSLWIDGNIEILDGFDMNHLIDTCLQNHDIALFKHPKRNCAYREARLCQRKNYDEPSIINTQMSKYRSDGYPENHGLTENRIILRRHTPKIMRLNETWWQEICNGSRRDQLSFNYSLWKNKITYAKLPHPIHKNPFFKVHKHLHGHYQIKTT